MRVGPRDAVMFDIDDTLLTSLSGHLIKPVYNIYKNVKQMGYKIIIVTARPAFSPVILWTKNQLRRHDITYDELIFASANDKGYYKRTSGYNFILSVGDMDTDLTDSLYAIKIST